ncbi:MAG TPA: glycosyltransferase [Gammaproteobacteria bacterium]|nr:glycosyltransferase [Gammaproteobacteria bacterium]
MTATTRLDISVIIPVYNRECFIGEAIDSALAQEDVNIEIILVDGASSDDTVAVARKHAPDIRVICEPDRGVADARNKGINIARAPWIAFLDADDIWKPEKLKLQLALMKKAPDIEFIFCDAWQYRDDEIILSSFLATREHYPNIPKQSLGDGLVMFEAPMDEEIMRVNYVVTTSTAMVRTQAARDVGGFDPTLKVCEDYEFWLRVAKGRKTGVVEKPLVGYRHHGTSLSDDMHAMAWGRVEVADRVAADDSVYPRGARDFFHEERWRRYTQLGKMAIHTGDVKEARSFFRKSLKIHATPGNLALYLATLTGRPGLKVALALKRILRLNLD